MKEIIFKGYHWKQSEFDNTKKNSIFYLALNMTSKCNYRCPYCFIGLENLKSSKNELNLQEKLDVIYQAYLCGAKVLSMPGKGEPLSDPHFDSILEYSNNLGLWVVVYTNGYFLNEERIKKLSKANISIFLKIDSFNKEIYEELVGKKAVFETIKENLNLLLKYFHTPKYKNNKIISRLGINSVVTVQSYSSIDQIALWCKKHLIYYTCRSPVKVGEAEITWDYLVSDKVNSLKKKGEKNATRSFTSATPLNQCGIYAFGITVENNGDIYVCPDAREGFDSIGNIRRSSLKELIYLKEALHPVNKSSKFCFVKNERNPEEVNQNKFFELPIIENSTN